jgi:hypothetical protein
MIPPGERGVMTRREAILADLQDRSVSDTETARRRQHLAMHAFLPRKHSVQEQHRSLIRAPTDDVDLRKTVWCAVAVVTRCILAHA